MKKFTLFLLLSSAIYAKVTAQDLPYTCGEKKTCDQTCGAALVIVNGFETELKYLAISPSNIREIQILKGEQATLKYGAKAANGVIIITTKPDTEFFTITDFVNGDKNKSVSKVQLDNTLLADMKKLLVDKSVFKQTLISSDMRLDQDCNLSVDNTLVVMTTLQEKKE